MLLWMQASLAYAEMKLGYVRVDRIMQSAQSLEAGKKLQAEFNPRKTDLEKLRKSLADKNAQIDRETLTMTESERIVRMRELNAMKLDLERKERELHEDFELRKQQELAGLQERINKAVAAVSANEGYDLVLYNSGAYIGKRVDITDKVIKALGK